MNETNQSHSMLYGALVTHPNAPSAVAAEPSRPLNKVAVTILGATLLSLLTLL